MVVPGPNRVWATLLTRSSYLPGAIILAETLKKHNSAHPLLVLVTPSLPTSSLRALELESHRNSLLRVRPVEPLVPSTAQKPTSMIAARFEDTWTKLRVLELTSYDAVCFLDADIALYKNMDAIFDTDLPGHDWLAACHGCVCTLDKDPWADPDWVAANCAWTRQTHPEALASGPTVPHSASADGFLKTHTEINGGVFLFHPSERQWRDVLHAFETSSELKEMMFPDQDFLRVFFRDRWIGLPWWCNALKTMRYWHENIWVRDGDVGALHYIVDKPWKKRIASDGIAGHMGRDGETHSWWWRLYEKWESERMQEGEEELLGIVREEVAPELTDEKDREQVQENKREGLPVPVPAH